MKAVIYTKYGLPDVLQLKEIEKPTPKDNEVLIKIHAASINSWDWDMLTGRPLEYRLLSGILKPRKTKILGCDIAGRIVSVGRNTKQFHPGDDVFGDLCEGSWGGFAEFVCARESELTLKPTAMTFEEAAATPQAGILALLISGFAPANKLNDQLAMVWPASPRILLTHPSIPSSKLKLSPDQ